MDLIEVQMIGSGRLGKEKVEIRKYGGVNTGVADAKLKHEGFWPDKRSPERREWCHSLAALHRYSIT